MVGCRDGAVVRALASHQCSRIFSFIEFPRALGRSEVTRIETNRCWLFYQISRKRVIGFFTNFEFKKVESSIKKQIRNLTKNSR